jgi:hypothetical protein
MRRASHWAALAVIGVLGTWAVLVIVAGGVPHSPGSTGVAQAAAAPAASHPVCDGDGTSGNRVQALYVRSESSPDRYGTLLPRFTEILSKADGAMAADGRRHVRFVHSADCAPAVANVVVPPSVLGDLPRLTDALRSLGFGRPDRTYVLWHDGAGCAVTSGSYAALGSSCWTWRSTAQQLQRITGPSYLVP